MAEIADRAGYAYVEYLSTSFRRQYRSVSRRLPFQVQKTLGPIAANTRMIGG